MTETLSYNPTEANAPEFSDDEQNSLEVAERLGQQKLIYTLVSLRMQRN